jgi:hypothetical protein
MYDCVNIGFPVIVFVDAGGFGGIAYALYPFQLCCSEAGG